MKKVNDNVFGLSPEQMKILQDFNTRQISGDVLDPNTKDAVSAINLASRIMNILSNGGQIDPVYIKNIISEYEKKLSAPEGNKPKKVIKKKKLKNSI